MPEANTTPDFGTVMESDVLAVRDWYNANREALKALVPKTIPKEEQDIKYAVPPALPAGEIAYNSPAFLEAIQQTTLILNDLGTDELKKGFFGRITKLAPLGPAMESSAILYDTLGKDLILPTEPQRIANGVSLIQFKSLLMAAKEQKLTPDTPVFEINKDNALNPRDPAFLSALSATQESLKTQKMTAPEIEKKFQTILDNIQKDPKTTAEQKKEITALKTLDDKAQYLLNEAQKTTNTKYIEETKKQILALNIARGAEALAPLMQDPAQATTPETKQTKAQPVAVEIPLTREEKLALLVQEAHPEAFMHKLMAVQTALNLPQKDGLYDIPVQRKIEKAVEGVFKNYLDELQYRKSNGEGKNDPDFLQKNMRIIGAQSHTVYEFDEEGNIYTVENQNGKLVRGPKSGNINQGIVINNKKERPHEATVALLGKLYVDKEKKLGQETAERDAALQHKSEQDPSALLYPLNTPVSDGTFFHHQHDTGATETLYDLLHYMNSDESYDPAKQFRLKQAAGLHDNILGMDAYNIMRNVQAGDLIPLHALYDENNPAQKESLLKAFGTDINKGISRQDVLSYVQKTFEERALKTPGITSLSDISQAMAEGKFNPYEKDVKLVFQALPPPSMHDPMIEKNINDMRRNGVFPTAEMVINNHLLTKMELKDLVGREFNGMTPDDKLSSLNRILNNPSLVPDTPEAQSAYERLTMNFYEDHLGGFTYWRNGDIHTHDQNTWNGRYGPPNDDQLLHIYMRYNWNKLDNTFGPQANILFKDKEHAYLNYDIKFSDLPPALAAHIKPEIDKLTNPSLYMDLIELRPDHYRDLRNDVYGPSLVKYKMPEAPHTQPEQSASNPAGSAAQNTDAQSKNNAPEQTQNNTPPTPSGKDTAPLAGTFKDAAGNFVQDTGKFVHDNGLAGYVKGQALKKIYDTATGEKSVKPVTPPEPSPEHPKAGTPPKTAPAPDSAKILGTAIEPETKEIRPSTRNPGPSTNAQKTESYLKDFGAPSSPKNPPALTHTPEPPPTQTRAQPALPAPETSATKSLPAPEKVLEGEYIPKEQPHSGSKPEPKHLPQKSSEIIDGEFRVVEETKTPPHAPPKTPALPAPVQPAAHSAAQAAIETVETGSRLFNMAAKAAKVIGQNLPWVGTGLVAAEAAYLIAKQEALITAGLIPENAKTAINSLYTSNAAAAGFDPTILGGDVVAEEAYETMMTEYGLDRATADLLKPTFISTLVRNALSDNILSPEETQKLKDTYSPENMEKMYERVIEKYNLPSAAKIDRFEMEVPLSIVLGDKAGTAQFLIEHPEYKDGVQALQILNEASAKAEVLLAQSEQAQAEKHAQSAQAPKPTTSA